MVTYEARYALSEDKLLRQKVDFVPLNVYLSVEGGKVPVKLLDCDTITQAKHKLQDAWYKGCAVSRRVSVDTLDLRLLGYNNDGGMVLRDDDGSNKCDFVFELVSVCTKELDLYLMLTWPYASCGIIQ
jgi:plexin A